MTIVFACPGCGRPLQVGDEYRGRRSKCPGCARVSRTPDGDAPDQSGAIQEQLLLREVEGTVDAYDVPEASPRCPSCQKVLPRRAVLCVDCGYDLRTGTRLDTVSEPFEARWSTGLPLSLRITFLVALGVFCLPAALFTGDRLSTAAFVFACTVFLVLLLGS